MRVLITGMSATGKSSVVEELRRLGFDAYDAGDDGFTEPAADGRWQWRVDTVAALLATQDLDLVFFAGCSEEQATFAWDLKVLLTAPRPVILDRLRARTSNTFGKSDSERSQVLRDMQDFEPLLRHHADAVIDSTQPLSSVVDEILAATRAARRDRR